MTHTRDIPDGTYPAVVDRIEDGLAAVLVEGVDEPLQELLVDPADLPEAARHADAVLRIEIRASEMTDVTYRPAETERRADRAQSRFDRLSQRPSEDEQE